MKTYIHLLGDVVLEPKDLLIFASGLEKLAAMEPTERARKSAERMGVEFSEKRISVTFKGFGVRTYCIVDHFIVQDGENAGTLGTLDFTEFTEYTPEQLRKK